MRKGQAAFELFMTYGWAILITMSAIGALLYLGLGDTSVAVPVKCVFSNGVSCIGSQITASQSFIVLRNSNTGSIYSLSANITNKNIACTVNPSAIVVSDQVFNITCDTSSLGFSKSAQFRLDLHFKKMPNGFDTISNGDIYNRVG